MYEVKLSSGRIIGPFNSKGLKDALQSGRVSGDDLVRRVGGGAFVPIHSVRGLREFIPRTESAPPPPAPPDDFVPDAPPTPSEPSSFHAASVPVSPSTHRSALPLNAGDRILRGAFSAGRWFSIIVISLGALTFVGAVIYYFMNSGFDARPAPVEQTVRPASAVEFLETCRVPNPPSKPSRTRKPAPDSSAATGAIDPCQKYRVRIEAITQTLGISDAPGNDGERAGDVICRWIEDLPFGDKEQFVAGFVDFSRAFQSTNPKPAQCTGGMAANYFHEEFLAALLAREERKEEEARIAAAENAHREAMKQLAVNIGGIAISTLLVFLFFPLLIQIERNTRPIAQ